MWKKSVKCLCTVGMFIFLILPVWSTGASLSMQQEMSLVEAIRQISKDYGVYFTFDHTLVKDITVKYETKDDLSIEQAISGVLAGTDLHFKFYDQRFVILYRNDREGLESLKQMMEHFGDIIKEGEKEEIKRNMEPLARIGLRPAWKPEPRTLTGLVLNVRGTVTDHEGEPLIGVNVLVKGTENGTATDFDGNYTLNDVNENATLIFSYIGYQTVEVPVDGRSEVSMRLVSDSEMLEEIVVVGYGSQRKSDITGAVSVIDVKKMGDIPVNNASRLLQGQAPGVQVRQTAGTPGKELEVTVRGLGSLGAGSSPLYVVDGFPIGTSLGQGLNHNDIESITVLKDAASTAIYGARGSNGVVLITTKKGNTSGTSLNFTANYGIQNIPDSRRTKMLNGVEFAQFKKESFIDKVRYFEGREPSIEEIPEDYRYPEQTQYDTDWFKEITNNNASYNDYNLSLSTGRKDFNALLSLGYLNQEGAVIETGFERFNIRSNIQGNVRDFISIGWNLVGSHSNEAYAGTDGRDALIGRSLWADPRYPVYNDDGSFNTYIGGTGGVFGTANLVQELVEMDRNLNKSNVLTNGYLEIKFLKDFKFRSSVNASLFFQSRKEFRPSTLAGTGFNQPPPREASLSEESFRFLNLSADQLLSYNKELGNHSFEGLLGYSAQEETAKLLSASGNEFSNDQVRFFDVAVRRDAGSSESSWSLLAYFARVNYAFKSKYLLSASYRIEGSSRFGANNKWGKFPAASLGWRISEEPFMPESDWLTDLKLRASFGITGNNAIGNYTSLSNLNATNYILGNSIANGQTLAAFSNADLGWEQSNQVDVGLDFALFDNRLIFTTELYKRITNDMLLSVEIPVISGFTQTISNVGKVENKGLELAVNYQTSINDFNLRSNFNISFNRNKVLEIRGENDEIWNGGFYSTYNVSKVGRPIGVFYGYRMMGIFNTDEEVGNWPTQDGAVPGVYKYYDANGDGVISYDQEDMIEIGNPHPAFIWAFSLGGDYENFDFNLLFTGAQDYDVFRNIEATTLNMDGVFNILASGKERWRSAESQGNGIAPTSNTWKWERESNSRYVYDASHAWLKSVSVGYTFPSGSVLKRTRIYLGVENLFLITQFPGSNPEINRRGGVSPGVDDEAYPVPRTFSMGLNVNL